MKTVKLKSDYKRIQSLISVLRDLDKVNSMVRFKLFKDKIMLYSTAKNDLGAVLAIKSYIHDISDFFDVVEMDEDIDYILDDCKKFIKNLCFFRPDANIKGKFTIRKTGDVTYVNPLSMSDGRFSFDSNGVELRHMRDITYETLMELFDKNPQHWKVKLNSVDFEDVISACRINDGDEDKIVSFIKKDDKFIATESLVWKLDIGEVTNLENNEDTTLTFHKKYLYALKKYGEELEFIVYGNFFLFKNGNQYYMIAYEKSY